METSRLICTANQLTGFYMNTTLALNGLTQEDEFTYYIVSIKRTGGSRNVHSITKCNSNNMTTRTVKETMHRC